MIQKIVLIASMVLFSFSITAQTIQVSGVIKDTATKANVKNAVVTLLTPRDSVLKNFTRVKEDGSYFLKNVTPGKYIVTVSHPSFGDFIDDIEINSTTEKLALIALTPKSKLLEAVIVKSGNPIRLKGDTTIYTADSFTVSANANV
ncbi:MAG: carboxypeptidase-like regulatory domain-containing protein [Ferruginibacter sp.]|nr:carboxypeptidase-like regulatory domain-containing protein [Ferruginibacter sp.]